MRYILDKIGEYFIENGTEEIMELILKMTKEFSLTPIDIAGRQGFLECVQVVLDFFKRAKESKFLLDVFN